MTTFRAAIIGAGSGGLTMAIGLAAFGHEVALIEGGPIGGDCTNAGCVPSKTLLHSARSGIDDPLAHVRARRDALEAREAEEMEHDRHIHLVRGWGRLTAARDPHVVAVRTAEGDAVEVRAEHIVICSGSRPMVHPIDGLGDGRLLTNENLFELETPPDRLLIVGGGAIAVEMATAFTDLGTAVHVVEREARLLPTDDPLISETIAGALARRGVEVHLGVTVERFEEATATAFLSNGERVGGVSAVLMAAGRRPRLDGLDLDAAGVARTTGGIGIDRWGRTNVKGIWAVGDVTGETATTHGANALGRRVVRSIAFPWLPKVGAVRAVPSAAFSDPQVATVGLSFAELEQHPAAARRRYVVPLAELDRGYTESLVDGVAVIDVERYTGRILRAAIVGPAAAELIGMFTIAIDHGLGMRKLFGMVHPYPAWAELVGRAADDFARDTYPAMPREWSAMVAGRLMRSARLRTSRPRQR
jgi:dihydrolipoamide dehydrogenase